MGKKQLFPTVSRTITETKVTFNFIRRVDGSLVETEVQSKLIPQEISKNRLQAQLQNEYPSEVIQILSLVPTKIKASMSIDKFLELAEKEILRTKFDHRLNSLAQYYYDRYSSDLHIYQDIYKCNLIDAFKHFQDIGVLEIITCGATHGYFPILYLQEQTA